jgi:hypothetical protein
VDHFDAGIKDNVIRNQYSNLMLACMACNMMKSNKRNFDPKRPENRMLNCTKENEFPDHIVEDQEGQWIGKTPAGSYHITCTDLNERSRVSLRKQRRAVLMQLRELEQPLQYTGSMDLSALRSTLEMIRLVREDLQSAVPLPTETGLIPCA